VEDDVAGDADSFRELIAGTARNGADLSTLEFEACADNPDWICFPTAEGFSRDLGGVLIRFAVSAKEYYDVS